jgi:nitrous oxidase accessory protein NosD
VEVEITQVSGPDNNDHGLLLHYVDNSNFYRFTISGLGTYSFDKSKDNQWSNLVEWTRSPEINTGKATNRLRVICKDNTFTLFINDVQVNQVADSDFPSGKVGVEAGTYKDPGTVHIAFDNIRVWAVK